MLHTLSEIDHWPVTNSAAGVTDQQGRVARRGETNRRFRLASVTKPLFAYGLLVAHEEGTLALDQPIDGTRTVADVMAHVDGDRRRYRNENYELLGQVLSTQAGMPAAQYFGEAVVEPLGLRQTELDGSPAKDAVSSVEDLLVVLAEWINPTLVDPQTMSRAIRPHRAEIPGIVPGYGFQDPNPWGLGPEIRGVKSPHWLGSAFSPETFGHFGQAGTFVWVDPTIGACGVVLTDEPFGPWAVQRWAPFNNAVRAELTQHR